MPFQMIRDDITTMKVDAIVNAANRSLLGGGGVDGAIHRAAGPELLEECRTLGGCETGQAKITKGYNLPARYVIHTVGPIWHGGENGEKELLMSCYRSSLELAAAHDCETVAIPLISAGAYGYPKDQAMAVAVEVITRFLFDHEMTVFLVLFGSTEFLTGKKLFRDIQEYIDDGYAASHTRLNVESARKKLWHEDEDAALDLDMELSEAKSCSEKKSGPFSGLARRMLSGSRPAASIRPSAAPPRPDWEEMVKRTDESFSEALLRLIDEKGMTDVECYKRANVDRRLFSKIRSNPAYCPSKSTVFAFAIALQLTLPETRELLGKAGYSFSRSRKMDIVLEYFIRHRLYNIWEINEVLFQLDLPLLGSNIG